MPSLFTTGPRSMADNKVSAHIYDIDWKAIPLMIPKDSQPWNQTEMFS